MVSIGDMSAMMKSDKAPMQEAPKKDVKDQVKMHLQKAMDLLRAEKIEDPEDYLETVLDELVMGGSSKSDKAEEESELESDAAPEGKPGRGALIIALLKKKGEE